MKVLTIVGARPQFIKAAPVSRALRAVRGIREVLVHTGQHYDEDMSDIFFRELHIPRPDLHLGVGSGSHGDQTGRMLAAIEPTIVKHRPDWVLVYGDTNSTLAGALAAAKLKVPVAHVEAGLRSFNRAMPEEINRVVADHLSKVLFAPTAAAVSNLRREGISNGRIAKVGDVMYDAALFYSGLAQERSRIMQRLGLARRGYVLATIHRAENTDDPRRLRAIFDGLGTVSKEIPVVLPLHPRTGVALSKLRVRESKGLKMVAPVGYLDMVMLEKNARLIATDSGGVQKEAFFFRVPCATLRHETEWVELVNAGWNTLVAPGRADIAASLRKLLHSTGRERRSIRPYGTGKAALAVASRLHHT